MIGNMPVDYIDKIHTGNCLEVMKQLPDGCIDCVVTSPPYFGLRSYPNTETLYGGAADCEHDFRAQDKTLKHKAGETNPGKEGWYKDSGASNDPGNSVCSKCGAVCCQLGLEPTMEMYLGHLLQVFDEVHRVLKPTGTCFVNIGDSYSGSNNGSNDYRGRDKYSWQANQDIYQGQKPGKTSVPAKCLCMIPERFAIGMIERGFILRNKIVWYKRNCLPTSAKDRFTNDWEYIFFFTKSKKYYFEQQFEPSVDPESYTGRRPRSPQSVPGPEQFNSYKDFHKLTGKKYPFRNMRAVWAINTRAHAGAHFAVFPPELPERCIRAGCPEFICKKCGKPREKTYKLGGIVTQGGSDTGKRATNKECYLSAATACKEMVQREHIFAGYTDCGCDAGWDAGIVLDPFCGSGTTAVVAKQLGMHWIGIELNPEYVAIAEARIKEAQQQLNLPVK